MKINQQQILLFVFGLPLSLFCQTGHGFSFDNYSGIYGAISNPANTVQSKYRWHINGISYNQMGSADFGAIDYLNKEANPNGFNGLNYGENIDDSSNSNFMVSDSDVLLPSVLWNINEKHALGLLLRSRVFSDYNNFNGQFFSDLNSKFNSVTDVNFDSKFNNTTQHWNEVGLNYALVLVNTNYHFIKFGLTAKYLMGIQAVELRGAINGSYSTGTTGDVTFDSANITYLKTVNENLPSEPEKFYSNIFSIPKNGGAGYGGDVGLVYEWRPRETNRMDVRSNAGAVNTYKLKISASIVDIGKIKYTTDIQKDNLITTGQSIISKSDINDNGLIETLKKSPNIDPNTQQGEVTFALPISLNIGLDYIAFNNKNYYINLNYIKSLTKPENWYANSRIDLITLTPRYETQKFSVYLPITYEQKASEVHAGLGLRFGPVTIGSATLSSLLLQGKMKHLYFGLSLPLFQDIFR